VAALKKWMSLVIESPTINVGDREMVSPLEVSRRVSVVLRQHQTKEEDDSLPAQGKEELQTVRLFKYRAPCCRRRRPARGPLSWPRNGTAVREGEARSP